MVSINSYIGGFLVGFIGATSLFFMKLGNDAINLQEKFNSQVQQSFEQRYIEFTPRNLPESIGAKEIGRQTGRYNEMKQAYVKGKVPKDAYYSSVLDLEKIAKEGKLERARLEIEAGER